MCTAAAVVQPSWHSAHFPSGHETPPTDMCAYCCVFHVKPQKFADEWSTLCTQGTAVYWSEVRSPGILIWTPEDFTEKKLCVYYTAVLMCGCSTFKDFNNERSASTRHTHHHTCYRHLSPRYVVHIIHQSSRGCDMHSSSVYCCC